MLTPRIFLFFKGEMLVYWCSGSFGKEKKKRSDQCLWSLTIRWKGWEIVAYTFRQRSIHLRSKSFLRVEKASKRPDPPCFHCVIWFHVAPPPLSRSSSTAPPSLSLSHSLSLSLSLSLSHSLALALLSFLKPLLLRALASQHQSIQTCWNWPWVNESSSVYI